MKKSIKSIKNLSKAMFSILVSLLLVTTAVGQDQLAIPLSNPGQSGQLNLSMVRGELLVSGYDGDEVIIRFDNGQENRQQREVNQNGLRRISGSGSGFEVNERNNIVDITNVSPMRLVKFDILVPRNFSLKLSMVHGDTFVVENVNGDLDINHVNGEVTLTNIGGSALVNTVNGDIKATFENVGQDKPMAFSNVNGNIDVTLPPSTRMTAKMRTEWGDMFTDFDMELTRGENISRNGSGSGYRVSVNNWVIGEINGGGPEYLFKTLRGDIYIRRR